MALSITVKFVKAFPAENVGQNNTAKRTFLVERSQMFNDEVITKQVALNVWKDKTSMLDKFNEGDKLEISFDLQSRENPKKDGQFFTELTAFKIEKKGATTEQHEPFESKEKVEEPFVGKDEPDDMPF